MEPVQVLAPDLVLVDWGPMTLTISAWRQGSAVPVIAAKAAHKALICLKDLARFKNYLKIRAYKLPAGKKLPPVVELTRLAAMQKPRDLSPMSAVAGAVADLTCQEGFDLGADKILVNNGGDIALRLGPSAKATVGVEQPCLDKTKNRSILGKLIFDRNSQVGGVATSGWQGRSLSKGVADMVTVWAENAARADALATWLGSAITVSGPGVEKVKGAKIDPLGDLADEQVVAKVLRLSFKQRIEALRKGESAARGLLAEGLIKGCLALVQDEFFVLDPGNNFEPAPRTGKTV